MADVPTTADPVVVTGANDAEPHVLDVAGLGSIVFASRAAPAKGRVNEDALAILPLATESGPSVIVAVADGAGGMPHADTAARLAVSALAAAVAAGTDAAREESVLTGFKTAHEAITDLRLGAASTLIAAWIRQDSIVLFHAGDSQAVIIGGRGKPKLVTVAHSPVGYAYAAGDLGEDEALAHPERHVVANLLGAGDVRVEWDGPRPLAARDTLLLGSDGVFDNLRIAEICALAKRAPLATAGAALLDACADRMQTRRPGQPSKPDDLTFVMFRRMAGAQHLSQRAREST